MASLTPEQVLEEEERATAHLLLVVPALQQIIAGDGLEPEEHLAVLSITGAGMLYGMVMGLRAVRLGEPLPIDDLIPNDISDLL